MWKGIVLGQGSTGRFIMCEIEDAQFALTVDSESVLSLSSNTFNRNFVSITNATNSHTLPFFYFKNNTFDCTSELSDYYDLDFTGYGVDPVSFAGILLEECSASIGVLGAQNQFNNLNYGIYAINSTVRIDGCEFNNSQHATVIAPYIVLDQNEGPIAPLHDGGVVGLNSNIFMQGKSGFVSCSFDNSDLIADASTLFITYATFLDGSISGGDGLNGESILIEHNTFDGDDRQSSISIRRSAASGGETHTNINYNTIRHLSPSILPSWGIHINGVNDPTDYASVAHNIIEFSGTNSTGIRFTGKESEGTLIHDNTIDWNGFDSKMTGIYSLLGNTLDSEIKDNTITGGTFLDIVPSTYGIRSFASSEILYCNNTIDYMGYGMSFLGDCNNSAITQNNLDHLGVGLLVEGLESGPGIIGVQDGTRTKWIRGNNYIEHSAELRNTNVPDVMNLYKVKESDLSDITLNPTNIDPIDDWFVPGDNHNVCYGIGRTVGGFDSLIITSDSIFLNYPEPIKFYLKKNLITNILQDDSLSSYYSSYLSSVSSQSEYKLAKVIVDLKVALQMDTSDQSDLDDLLVSMEDIFDSISIYDKVNYLNIDTTSFTDGSYLDSILSKLDQIYTLDTSQRAIKSTRMTALLSDLSGIKTYLDGITTRSTFDLDYKNIYSLRIKEIVDGSLDSADYVLLNDIAQNTADSSLANITAFALFDLCDESSYPDYSNNCEAASPLQQNNNNDEQLISKEDKVKPVLLSDAIRFDINVTFPGYIAIFDITGKKVSIEYFDANTKFLQINTNLSPGIYYYTIINKNTNSIFKSGLIPAIW